MIKLDKNTELEIIDLYSSTELNTVEIAEKLSVSNSCISKVLKRNNIAKKIYVSKIASNEDLIVESYLSGKSADQVGKEFKTSSFSVYEILKKNNIERRDNVESHKSIILNNSVFDDINTKEKAYWLGCIYFNISLFKDCLRVTFNDRAILQGLIDFINSNITIKQTKNNFYISLTDSILEEKFIKIGIERKREYRAFPKLENDLLPSFINGLLDAQGLQFTKSKNLKIGIIYYPTFMKQLYKQCNELLNNTLILIDNDKELSSNTQYGTMDFFDWVYKNSYMLILTNKQLYETYKHNLAGRKLFTDEEEKNICVKYERLSELDIAKQYNVSGTSIGNLLNSNNISKRKKTYLNRTYDVDENFFERIDSEEKAYLLGYFLADGNNNVGSNCISINLNSQDIEILYKFQKLLKTNRPIREFERIREGKVFKHCTLAINNEKLSKDALKWGIITNKTYLLKYPYNIENNLHKHLIRGYFDGDGSTPLLKDNNTVCKFISTENMCEGIKDNIAFQVNIKHQPLLEKTINKSTGLICAYVLKYASKYDTYRIMEWLYEDATIYLQRKFDKWQKIKSEVFFDPKLL